MNEFYCIDIEFPDIDFSNYYIRENTEIEKVHHAHLYSRQDEIELRIFYKDTNLFGERLSEWIRSINSDKFGSFIKITVSDNQTNQRLQKIDLSEAKFKSLSNSSGIIMEIRSM